MKKISFIFIFILCLCFSSVFAGENLTINEFKKILNDNNITVPEDVTFPSAFNDLLNANPIVFLSYDKSEIVVVNGYGHNLINPVLGIEGTNSSMQLAFGYSKYDKSYISGYVGGNNVVPSINYFYKINLSDFSFYEYDFLKYGYNNGSYDTIYINKCYLGYLYSQVSDNYTYDDFKLLNHIKNFLETNMLFCGIDNLYYNNSDVNYRFNGVYVGQGDKITGTTMWSNDDTKFIYTNTYSENQTFFYLQDVPLSEITEWSANDYSTLSDMYNTEYIVKQYSSTLSTNMLDDVDSYSILYQNLAKKLEQGHIYRLYARTVTYSTNSSR